MNDALKKLVMLLVTMSFAVPALAKDTFKMVHVKDLSEWISEKPANLYVFDANNEKTRKEKGTIPGATLLSGIKTEDVSSALPKDKSSKLVFYCANTQCMASHDAAKVATAAGFKDVNVMADGIQGWVKAGQQVAAYKK